MVSGADATLIILMCAATAYITIVSAFLHVTRFETASRILLAVVRDLSTRAALRNLVSQSGGAVAAACRPPSRHALELAIVINQGAREPFQSSMHTAATIGCRAAPHGRRDKLGAKPCGFTAGRRRSRLATPSSRSTTSTGAASCDPSTGPAMWVSSELFAAVRCVHQVSARQQHETSANQEMLYHHGAVARQTGPCCRHLPVHGHGSLPGSRHGGSACCASVRARPGSVGTCQSTLSQNLPHDL